MDALVALIVDAPRRMTSRALGETVHCVERVLARGWISRACGRLVHSGVYNGTMYFPLHCGPVVCSAVFV